MLKKKKNPPNYINFNYYFSSKNYLKRFAESGGVLAVTAAHLGWCAAP
jgi:hypothetical protein